MVGLLAIAVFMVLGRSMNSADLVLAVTSALPTVDGLVCGLLFTFFYPTSEQRSDFVDATFSLSVYVTASTICLLFPFFP